MGLSRGGASGLPQLEIDVSLYRRNRIWWIKLTAYGRRVRESTGTTDKRAAQEFHERRKGEIWRQAKLGEKPPVTWGEAVAKWLRAKPRGLPDRYRLAKLTISPTKNLPIESSSVETAIASFSPSTHNRILALIVAIHNASGVTPPAVKRRPTPLGRTRWLTEQEWGRLRVALEAESSLLRQAADFTLATGLRENNVLNLEWAQIDLQRRVTWLHADQMKGRVPHGLPLNDAAMAVLKERRGAHKRYVFPNPDTGLPYYKASNRAWYAALKRAKLYRRVPGSKRLEVCWHTLRHTWASWHRMNGTSLEDIQDLGAWKDPKMVKRYAHLSTEHLAAAAARVKPVSLGYNAPRRVRQGTK